MRNDHEYQSRLSPQWKNLPMVLVQFVLPTRFSYFDVGCRVDSILFVTWVLDGFLLRRVVPRCTVPRCLRRDAPYRSASRRRQLLGCVISPRYRLMNEFRSWMRWFEFLSFLRCNINQNISHMVSYVSKTPTHTPFNAKIQIMDKQPQLGARDRQLDHHAYQTAPTRSTQQPPRPPRVRQT